MCLAEFISGFSVLTGVKYKTGLWGVLLLLALFTPLTFILALTNPVSDCGCFGDAIHLTNWQTFGKNMFLVVLLIIAFTGRNQSVKITGRKTEWAVLACVSVVFILFSLANLRYLPMIDFLPYKKDTKIADKMIIPEGVAVDKYETTFIYEKDGIKKEYNLNNYPANDSTWKFVEQNSVLVSKGYVPPIHDFMVTSLSGEDLTQKILNDHGYSLLMVTKKLAGAGHKELSEGFKLGNYCTANNINFYILTSSGKDEISGYENGLTFCSVDETTLKTMVRSNPGYILIRDGVIIEKWSWAKVPDIEWFSKLKR
jgi:triosephosphate isomerase